MSFILIGDATGGKVRWIFIIVKRLIKEQYLELVARPAHALRPLHNSDLISSQRATLHPPTHKKFASKITKPFEIY
jgi:hypothetical protein